MKKKNFKQLFILSLILMFSCVAPVSAHFPLVHDYITIKAYRETSSPLTRACSLDLFIAGNAASDTPVVHYLEGGKELSSYVGTHTYNAHVNGFRKASTTEERCFVHGNPMHMIQDSTAHLEDGIVPSRISKLWGTNLLIHGMTERAFEKKMLSYLKEHPDPSVSIEEIKYYSAHSLDPILNNEDLMNVLNEMTGIDSRNDVGIVDKNLKAANGESTAWDKTVYGKKVSLPFWAYGLTILGLIIGLAFIAIAFMGLASYGKLSYLDLSMGLLIIFASAMVLISLITGRSWLWYNYIISYPIIFGVAIALVGLSFIIPALLGWANKFLLIPGLILLVLGVFYGYELVTTMQFSDTEYEQVITTMLVQTEHYMQDEQLNYDDVTGLTYCKQYTNSGNCLEYQQGALSKSEWKYKYFVLPITTILIFIFLYWRIKNAFRGAVK